MKTIRDIDIKGKTILVRVDYNVPMQDGTVTSDLRIRASLPTLEYLRDRGAAKIILISHLGRPDGADPSFSLEPVAEALDDLIGHVSFIPAVSGTEVTKQISSGKDGDIFLLENLRFYPGEKHNDPVFIQHIIDSVQPDFYVQDAFAVLHRAHASTDAVKDFLPIYAGLLVEHEVTNLQKVITNPARPLLLILGGSKVEDKQSLIDQFTDKLHADHILIGGKIAADGYQPTHDNITVARDFDEDGTGAKLDIGPLSTADFANHIIDAQTIIWNGVLGRTEDPAYATASTIIAELLGESEDKTTIICGGDTTGFVENLISEHNNLHYTLISTGGGASLEYLCGKPLPGLANITK
ncbi:phosphoglycerate kinase [Candidatus Saccharibacteria bacterium]|nr:phosphoglycerate kinase [Candidatus Saccharibacteria bacterium]